MGNFNWIVSGMQRRCLFTVNGCWEDIDIFAEATMAIYAIMIIIDLSSTVVDYIPHERGKKGREKRGGCGLKRR